ncbi:MAG TPA: tetraacyldisaccharide 4'-kinase [Blastocatellia bacterium]|jgi:tetraacyldisaccharide 4'-kinase|nr:tetraacyldisaccharide 4'-kinase [Blastocatellia bacterium]
MIDKNQKLKRALIWLPAKLYELLVRVRVAAYETGYLKAKQLQATVIGIGNITVGGTGKTPLVEYIARYLRDEGYSVAILTRGYSRSSRGRRALNVPARVAEEARVINQTNEPALKRKNDEAAAHEFGDEALMLARSLGDVPVVVDRNRFEGGEWAEKVLGSEVFILDDGYQHLQLARDLNIILLDATDPFGEFEMVPFGRLREPLYGLKRADVVIITRAHRPFDQAQVQAVLKLFSSEGTPVLYFYSIIPRLRHLSTGETYDSNLFAGWNAALMCGIGNPHAFADDVLQIGVNIVRENFFADHHSFTQSDVDNVVASAREVGADAIIVTEKDAVRFDGLTFDGFPAYAAQLVLQSDDEVRLKSLLLRVVTSTAARK